MLAAILSFRNFTHPFERYRLRDAFPFTGNLFEDYEMSVWVYWILAAGALALVVAAAAYLIDKSLDRKELK